MHLRSLHDSIHPVSIKFQRNVRTAFQLLLALIAAAPLLFADTLLIHGLLGTLAAAFGGVIAFKCPSSDLMQLRNRGVRFAVFFLVPVIWIAFQAIPWPWPFLHHPVWISAASALQRPLTGSITLDTGATLVALICAISAVTLMFVVLGFALDRVRAKWILFALLAACMGAGVVLIGFDLPAESRASLEVIMALGTVVSSAAIAHVVERAGTQRRSPGLIRPVLTRQYLPALVAGAATFAACFVLLAHSASLLFAVITGAGWCLFVGVMLIRRAGLGRWALLLLGGVLVIAVLATASLGRFGQIDITLRFATRTPAEILTLNERILDATNALGNGAGTFEALVPLHRDPDEQPSGARPATVAAAISIDLGRPMLWLLVVLSLAAAALLSIGALDRGRDAYYPAAGAAGLVILTLSAFITNGLFAPSSVIVIAALLGLAQAQSAGRQGT